MPENGTSLHNVGPSPRHRNDTPCLFTIARTDERTERSVWGLSGERGVDCKLVRTSSRGEAKEVIAVRAIIPETSGTMASEGISGGSAEWTNQS